MKVVVCRIYWEQYRDASERLSHKSLISIGTNYGVGTPIDKLFTQCNIGIVSRVLHQPHLTLTAARTQMHASALNLNGNIPCWNLRQWCEVYVATRKGG